MKFSYNWLCSFVEGLDAPAESLERLITMKTAECEGIERTGEMLAQASVAEVLEVEVIADTKLVKARVRSAVHGLKTVVCGAPNCRAGLITVYVPLGVKTIQGVESDGMLASTAELDINRDHSGIVELAPDTRIPSVDEIGRASCRERV